MVHPNEAPFRELAARQYSLVALEQAQDLGMTRDAVRHRIACGSLERVTPRVLGIVGRRVDRRETLMAGTLDGGSGTVVGRRSGAAVWQVPGFPLGPVELTRRKGVRSRPPSVGRLFTVRYLPDHLVTTVDGLPVVSLPYLLFQLAGSERPARVERALDTICARSPAVHSQLERLLPELAEHGRNGIVLMREWLRRNPPGSGVVESGLERRFERILSDAGERALDRQIDAGGHEWIGRTDFVDRELAAIFEVDSATHHSSELDVANDADRDEQLLAAGWRAVARIPEEWIWYEPARAVDAVRRVRRSLRARPETGSGS